MPPKTFEPKRSPAPARCSEAFQPMQERNSHPTWVTHANRGETIRVDQIISLTPLNLLRAIATSNVSHQLLGNSFKLGYLLIRIYIRRVNSTI